MSYIGVIIKWLTDFWNTVLAFLKWFLDGLILLLQFVFFSIFDGLLLIIEAFFSTLDLSAIALSYSATWANLPTQSIWLMNQIALPQGLALLAGAYLIRLTLNLIPSWGTRV